MAKTTNFIVAIDGVALSVAQTKQINAAVQKAALSELATLGIRGTGLGTHFPREWLGIWIGPYKGYSGKAIEALAKNLPGR
jgi:hypothetical protein